MMKAKGFISWFTPPLPSNMGYGIAAVETIRAIQRCGVRVDWNDTTPYVHINFIQPEMYEGHGQQYRIGYTPWESTAIPEMWIPVMRTQDEIWATSQFVADIYDGFKVNKDIKVVPHGINSEIYPIVDRTLSDKFIFLHIGGPAERKGGQMAASAFVEVFKDIEDAVLIMKSRGPSEARWHDRYIYRGNIKNHPRVQVVEEEMTQEQLFKLYEMAHCMVYPGQGEGFGLIPWQGIATGLPTITTNLTGLADFAEMSIPLSATWGPGHGVHLGNMAVPNYEELKELMLDVYQNWETHKKKAMKSAKIIHSTQTWDHVGKKILNILGDKIEYTTDIEEFEGGSYTNWVKSIHGAGRKND